MKYFILILFLLSAKLYSQDFKSQALVTLQGQNKNYVLTKDFYFKDVFLCYENFNAGKYSILLQKVFPYDSNLITVVSDTLPQINPTILQLENRYDLKIVWQAKINGYWQLLSKDYSNGIPGSLYQITSDSTNNIDPSISWSHIFWIRDSNLVAMRIADSSFYIQLVDSGICSNPDASNYGENVIYEQGKDSSDAIKMASYNFSDSTWSHVTLINPGYNLHPKGGFLGFSYQKFQNGIWKAIVETGYDVWISENETYNVQNPVHFNYPFVTKSNIQPIKDPFVIYESDSIPGNSEIYLDYIWENGLPKVNISNLSGDDIKPDFIWTIDSVITFWEHWENNESQIWWAKAEADFGTGIEPENKIINHFALYQNYPNPFNAQTKIAYHLQSAGLVQLDIFDIRGRLIQNLVNESQKPGDYSIIFDASNLASGIYYYRLKTGSLVKTKKMILLK